jgi:hypothetical protein
MLAQEGHIPELGRGPWNIINANFYNVLQEPASWVTLTGVGYASACDRNRLRSTKNCVTVEL